MDRCWAFCVAFNERLLLPYWLRHYRTFCEHLVVYDHRSDDGTADIAAAFGAEVRRYEPYQFDDAQLTDLANRVYKEARGKAQWVVWADADEFLYHPRMKKTLRALKRQDVTVPHVTGYCMVSDSPPKGQAHIYRQIPTGFRAQRYDKPCLISPDAELVWGVGKHDIAGEVRRGVADEAPRLLHYRWFGQEWCAQRSARNYARMTDQQKAMGYGVETYPGATVPYSPAWYAQQVPTAQEVV